MYRLRHVAISEMIAGGVDTFLVAKLAGTSTAMIDKHHGHLRHEQSHWAVWVSGNWRMTFKFDGADACVVDYQDCH